MFNSNILNFKIVLYKLYNPKKKKTIHVLMQIYSMNTNNQWNLSTFCHILVMWPIYRRHHIRVLLKFTPFRPAMDVETSALKSGLLSVLLPFWEGPVHRSYVVLRTGPLSTSGDSWIFWGLSCNPPDPSRTDWSLLRIFPIWDRAKISGHIPTGSGHSDQIWSDIKTRILTGMV